MRRLFMLTIISGVGLLLLTLAGFSLFSMKAPKGSEAMSGMANAAIATFLIEAVHKYITGDLFNLDFSKLSVPPAEVWVVLQPQSRFLSLWAQILCFP